MYDGKTRGAKATGGKAEKEVSYERCYAAKICVVQIKDSFVNDRNYKVLYFLPYHIITEYIKSVFNWSYKNLFIFPVI